MKLKAIACFLLLILPLCLSAEFRSSHVEQTDPATEHPEDLDKAIETAIWNYIRHERRLLAAGDLFEINIAAAGNGFRGRMRSLWYKWKHSIRSFVDSLEES